MSFVGREELPYSLRTLHMDRLLTMAREARREGLGSSTDTLGARARKAAMLTVGRQREAMKSRDSF